MAQKVILIVGDCYALNYLIDTVLSNDFNVLCADSCAEAIKYLHSNLNIKAIILDIPDVTAENYSLLEHVHSSSILSNIKTVVISNSNDQGLVANTAELGSVLYLTKPFDPVYLSDYLKSILNSANTEWFIKRADLLKMSIVHGRALSLAAPVEPGC